MKKSLVQVSLLLVFTAAVALAVLRIALADEVADLSLNGLARLTQHTPAPVFEHVRNNPELAGIRQQLVAYQADGLRQFALIMWPRGESPTAGWPVLIFNHGYHPDPPNYGRIADGSSSRPGDYYRGLPRVFAEAGYVVLVPDYRGHNQSEGAEYTRSPLAPFWYTRDVLLAWRALQALPDVDVSRLYMHGHSMGGGITQLALLALGERVKAASVWSTIRARGFFYGALQYVYPRLWLDNDLAALQVPLMVQHARGDQTTPVENGEAIAQALAHLQKPGALYVYNSGNHLFTGADFAQAVQRDLQWFAAHP